MGQNKLIKVLGGGWGASIPQNSSKLHSYTHGTLLGPNWQKLESDNQLEESTQTYWGITVSHPLMYLGLTIETGVPLTYSVLAKC